MGDVCKYGHSITGDNVATRKTRNGVKIRCARCEADRNSRYQKTDKGKAAGRRNDQRRRGLRSEYHREYAARLASEREDSALAKKDDDKATAPWNYLKPREAAMPLWIKFQKYMDENRTPCYDKPELYSDYDDPRYPEKKTGRPFPSTGQAEALCADCPVRELCLAYALKQKEDSGIWGGKRIVAGRVYTGATKKEAGK